MRFALGLAALAFTLTACGGGGSSSASPSPSETRTPDPVITTPSTIIVRGSIAVPADIGSISTKGEVVEGETSCSSAGGYGDISPGAQVTIRDNANNIVALGQIESGTVAAAPGEKTTYLLNAYCSYPFTVTGVPPNAPFYSVEVAHRGQVNETRAEMFGDVALTLGTN